jgi:ABC-2 type transport system ATP-binding protein
VAIIDRGRVLDSGRISDISQRLRVGEVLRVRIVGEMEATIAAQGWFAAQAGVVSADILPDGQVELGFRGDQAGAAALLSQAIGAGLSIASFAPAATDLQELFLQVTGQVPAQILAEPADAAIAEGAR